MPFLKSKRTGAVGSCSGSARGAIPAGISVLSERILDMPGFTTHYLFGVNTYKQLKNDALKKIIFDHHAAFSLGLQGPDIFFYYLPSYVVHENNIGSVAHIKNTGAFLSYLLESPNLFPDKEEARIAQAYVMGFVGHYLLDRSCHPYIYWRTRYEGRRPEYYGHHMNLETDIDAELLSFYKHKLPSSFRRESTIMLTRLELRTVATILYYVYSMAYPELKVTYTAMRLAIRSMQVGMRLLHDSRGQKKVLTRKIEGLTVGHTGISAMMPSDSLHFYPDPLNVLHREWHNPWDETITSRESFLDLMEEAQQEYKKLLPRMYRLFLSKRHSESAKLRLSHILDALGNVSYHSGLDPEMTGE